MGFPEFYGWLRQRGYNGHPVHVKTEDSLLVDFKTFAYMFAYAVPVGTSQEEFIDIVTQGFVDRFVHFESVTFVNDGKITSAHPKFATVCARSEMREKQRQKVEVHKQMKEALVCLDENPDAFSGNLDEVFPPPADQKDCFTPEDEKWEKRERAARGVSFDDCLQIMVNLKHFDNFTCLQCKADCEADVVLIAMGKKFKYVLSEDSDLLIGGLENVVRGFGKSSGQVLYRSSEILANLRLTKRQLQEVACIAGNDYKETKIVGMGRVNAYKMILQYGDCATMIKQYEFIKNGSRFTKPPDLLDHLEEAIVLFNPTDAASFLDEGEQKKEEQEDMTTSKKKRKCDVAAKAVGRRCQVPQFTCNEVDSNPACQDLPADVTRPSNLERLRNITALALEGAEI